jgi:peptidoglycan hydrolase-like protein with peptidoglycan-binding domain
MQTIQKGSSGDLVERWQNFLLGQGLYPAGIVDGQFGDKTVQSTKAFQTQQGLTPVDGIVGKGTWTKAEGIGLPPVEDDGPPPDTQKTGAVVDKSGADWPPPPTNLQVPSSAARQQIFGSFQFEAASTAGNPEGIKILGNWSQENIVSVDIPQLIKVQYGPKNGKIPFHKKAADQVKGLFQAWEDEGLMDRVLTWAGSWNPRFIRGSRTVLSNHAFATAFDICAPQNGLGIRPALLGQKGCVRELVETANRFGFGWGGHYPKRPDGMHFECVRIL